MHPYFQQNYHYCPKCGYEFTEEDYQSVKLVCPQCGFEVYENPTPTVAAVIVQQNKILLAKRSIEPRKNTWDSVGGFVEVGETLEQACLREMEEETGLKGTIKDYLGNFPDTYFDKPTLTAGFVVEIGQGEPQAQDDVAELKWFNKKEIPFTEIGFPSVANIIKKYLKKDEK